MKAMVLRSPGGSLSVRTGFCRVLISSGFPSYFYELNKPVLDSFAECEPDLLISTTYDMDRPHLKAIKARPNLKVALFGSAYGPINEEIDRERFPIDLAKPAELDMIKRLQDETGRPNLVYIHAVPSKIDYVLGYWRDKLNVPIASILNGADTFEYLGGQYDEALACDIGFCGGYLEPYKTRNINPILVSLCHKKDLRIKIFGYGNWPVAQYLGTMDGGVEKHLFKSAKVCLNISEPHSNAYGYDLVERPFKVMAAGGFCISDYVEGFNEVFGKDVVPMGRTPKQFEELIRYYMKHEDEREELITKQRKISLDSHTYWHRVYKLLSCLGLHTEANTVFKRYEELRPSWESLN